MGEREGSRRGRSREAAARGAWALAFAAALASACVAVDSRTGKNLPRDGQEHAYEDIQRRAEGLVVGMTALEVLSLLGSPAERSGDDDVWVYLPERPAVLVPARAQRLQFERGKLSGFGYRPIVLGQDL